jgi:hypothetical protein
MPQPFSPGSADTAATKRPRIRCKRHRAVQEAMALTRSTLIANARVRFLQLAYYFLGLGALNPPILGEGHGSPARTALWWRPTFWICILLAALLRLAIFPHGLSPAVTDEANYLTDGLNVIEGFTPGHKYAPSAPLTWFTTLFAGIGTLYEWITDKAGLAGFSPLLRPPAALEITLFHIYADMSTLRLWVVALTVALSIISVAAVYRLGYAVSGPAAALVGGLLAASLPVYLDVSVQTRPYATAWAFALMGLSALAAGRGRSQSRGAGILLGFSIGSHIDMLRIGPLALLMLWRRESDKGIPWRDFVTLITATLITFLLIAPWYVTHLIDNVRQIISVRILPPPPKESTAWAELFDGGIVVPLVATLSGLLLASFRRRWPDVLCGLWLLVNTLVALRLSSHGLFHDGAVVVTVIALAPIGVSALSDQFSFLRKPASVVVLILLLTGIPLYQGASFAANLRPNQTPDDAVAWVETHVPPGTRVYTMYRMAVPLPTAQAAERLWTDVAAPDAWLPKYLHDIRKFGLHGTWPLRVMSEDRIVSDAAFRRRYYILGAPIEAGRPRYDVWEETEGSFYDLTPDQIVDRLCKEGGVWIRYGSSVPNLPPPVASWPRPDDDRSTYVYWVKAGSCPKMK